MSVHEEEYDLEDDVDIEIIEEDFDDDEDIEEDFDDDDEEEADEDFVMEEEVEVDEEEEKDKEDEDEEEKDKELEEEKEEEEDEEVYEKEDDYDEDGDEGLNYKELYGDDVVKSNKKSSMRIERFCKSQNENEPRCKKWNNVEHFMVVDVLSKVTTEKNAIKFAPLITSKEQLIEICGKFMKKEFNYLELYKELKKNIWGFESQTYKEQHKIERREIEISTTKMPVEEGLYVCKKCKSKKTYSRQIQTRSADEGMTSIIQCAESNCGLVWREYA